MLHHDRIHSIDFEQNQKQNHWQLQLDDALYEPELYPMRYGKVLSYGDENRPSYSSFKLLTELVPYPINKTATQNWKEGIQTDPTNWTVPKDSAAGRIIEPIPYTGESEEFSVKIRDEEIAGVMDVNDDICFSKIIEFCLLHFNHDVLDNGADSPSRPPLNIWEWQAARMRNFMMYLIDHYGFNPGTIALEIMRILFLSLRY